MNIIVAADSKWGIGNKGKLPISIPAERKMFREETLGKVLVLGRKTLETYPAGLPLPERTTIVLSSKKDYSVKGAKVVHSIDELMEELQQYDTQDVYIGGGESIFRQLLPYVDKVHVARIDKEYEADAFFENLDKCEEWKVVAESDEQVYFDVTYEYICYQRC